jgi:purine-binding chemotaxis protein CheW
MSLSTASSATTDMEAGGTDATDQYLTFILAGEEYGVDILRVQEIRGWSSVTHIPNTPGYIRGILNLRGTIVPIIDLRLRFHLDKIDYGPTTVIVVLKVVHESHRRIVGLVVDGVSDVYNVREHEMKPAPDFGVTVKTEFIRGMAAIAEKMVILLDIDRLLNADELTALESVASKNKAE